MTPSTRERASRQLTMDGKPAKRGRIKYRKLFSRHKTKKKAQAGTRQNRGESEAEERIISWLDENKISFEAHGAIPRGRIPVDANKLLEEVLSNFSAEDRELLTTKLQLKKIDSNRAFGRYDFKVEGNNRITGKPETYFIEYWGMYNPNVKITKENLRRLYNRLLINYTFIKKPLKEKYYRSIGLNLISLTRSELKKQVLDEKLGCLLSLEQRHLITNFMPSERPSDPRE